MLRAIYLTVATMHALSSVCAASLSPARLRCEFSYAPLGMDTARPRLSWQLETTEAEARGVRQSAYRIHVASSRALLTSDTPDLWDSGRVESSNSTLIPYAGAPLEADQKVFWSVRIWDGAGGESNWSTPATWTMGALTPSDWRGARWIGADPGVVDAKPACTLSLRRGFTVRKDLVRALIHVTGVGHYELSVNGKKIGDQLLAPGWTDYRKTILYDTFDVTDQILSGGANALGIVLGNGMYHVPKVDERYAKLVESMGHPQAIARLRLDYVDGSVEFVVTDDQWQVSLGPTTFSHVYGGEDFDARLESRDWDTAQFATSEVWSPAVVLSGPGGVLRGASLAAPPVKAIEELTPVSVQELRSGLFVYDLGQNASVMPRIHVRGTAGSIIRITPAELLKADGTVDRISVGSKPAYWQYTLGSTTDEVWFPKFFYQGARYLQVETLPAEAGGGMPQVLKLKGVVVHTSAEPIGTFDSSNPLLNRIRMLVRWAQRSNLVSIITDCPHREKLGWLEQYHLNGPSLRFEHDLSALFNKTFQDMADAQTPEGLITDIAPEYTVFEKGFRDSPEWGSAIILAAWQQYVFNGDVSAFERNYDAMARYMGYLDGKSRGHMLSHGLGDWYDIGPKPPGLSQLTPIKLTASATYYENFVTLARIAAILGKQDDACAHAARAASVRAAFNRELFDAVKRSYATGSQTSNAMPYVLGLVDPADAPAVLDAIVADVQSRGNSITAGDVGYRYLLRALSEGERSDVVYAMNNQSEKPGYGYQLAMGATSLTEAWDANPHSSQNHFMLGQIVEWLYHDLTGIQPDPEGPGFRKFFLKPAYIQDLGWVRASYASPQGKIEAAWRNTAGQFVYEVTVPPNTHAIVSLPCTDPSVVKEGNGPASSTQGVRLVGVEGIRTMFEVGSGRYVFSLPIEDVR